MSEYANFAGNRGLSPIVSISHAVPKNLLVDEVVHIGQVALSAVGDMQAVRSQAENKQESGV